MVSSNSYLTQLMTITAFQHRKCKAFLAPASILLSILAAFAIGCAERQSPEPNAASAQSAPVAAPSITNATLTNEVGQATTDPLLQGLPAADLENDPDHWALMGEKFLNEGKLDQAVAAYRRSLELYPEGEDVLYNLGIILARQGKTAEAIASYEKALEIAPDYAEAHNNLGNLLAREGRVDEAIKHFQEAILVNPDHAPSYNNLGTALGRQKRNFEAIDNFTKAVALDPGYLEARYNLGVAFKTAGMLDDAVRELEGALRLQPDFRPARAQLALIARMRAQQQP